MKKRLSLCLTLPLVLLTACSGVGGSANYEPDKLPLDALPASSNIGIKLDDECPYLDKEDIYNATGLNTDLTPGTDAAFTPNACLFLDGQKPVVMAWIRSTSTDEQAQAVSAGYLPLSNNNVQMGDWHGRTYTTGANSAVSYYKDNKVVTVISTVPGVRVDALDPLVRKVIEKNNL